MNERQYNKIGKIGVGSLVIGIMTILFGVAAGVLMIINGASLFRIKNKMLI